MDIYDIQVADEGTIATDDHCGPLFEGTDYRTKKIKIEGGMADFNGVRFPINPMIGVIGTAPDEGAPADGFVGNYGGNMDNKLITKGTRLYFPVRVPGALLQMGDVHATMGDAELCGTGIEIAAQITVRVNVLKNFELHWPVLETFGPAGKWYVNASAQEYNEALVCASKEMRACSCASPDGTPWKPTCTCRCNPTWRSARAASPARCSCPCASAPRS